MRPPRLKLAIETTLDYDFAAPSDVLLQIEAALLPEQTVTDAWIDISPVEHFARLPGHDTIGDRLWLHLQGKLQVRYTASVTVDRLTADLATLPAVPPHKLPVETVDYLLPSRYCPSDQFQTFVEAEFGSLHGGERVMAMHEWIGGHLSYVPGASTSSTTALETFVTRQGVCRD